MTASKKIQKAVAKKAQTTPLVPVSMADVQNKIIVLHGEPMILDRDVARLYGVETREINQALKNNPKKFPANYTYTLNNQEVAEMRSKILTSSSELTENEAISFQPNGEENLDNLRKKEIDLILISPTARTICSFASLTRPYDY